MSPDWTRPTETIVTLRGLRSCDVCLTPLEAGRLIRCAPCTAAARALCDQRQTGDAAILPSDVLAMRERTR